MSDSPALSPSKSLACQRDPQRWFDRRHRRDTLAQCLTCAARPWCAQEALKCRASWGMWAGVWIEERHSDAVPYLQAIAADEPGLIERRPAVAGATTSPQPLVPAPLSRPPACTPSRSAPAAVLARSSGHCEIFAQGCRYTFDRLVSRRPSERASENPSPAELFAGCGECAQTVASLNPQLAARLGYLVDAGRDPAAVPFHWRASRWVLLGRDGWLTELGGDAEAAVAT